MFKSKDYSIEYAHIYVNQTFNSEHLMSLELMKSKENELKQIGFSVARHVLIDDYSTATGLDRFNKDGFLQQLKTQQAEPDITVLESTLLNACNELINKINDKKLRKSLTDYYKTRKIWPCSICVAAWYLVRLGAIKYKEQDLVSGKVISILPDRFKTPELEAKNIIEATEFRDYIKKIEVIFFESSFTKYSQWSEFDTKEYANRNYLQKILPEDKSIISFVVDYMIDNCDEASLDKVIDVGAGPNFYPTLLIKPFISKTGSVHLIDPVLNNRKFLEYSIKHSNIWSSFTTFLNNKNPNLYKVHTKMPNILIQEGDIFNLKKESYDLVMAFFVAESITDDPKKVKEAM